MRGRSWPSSWEAQPWAASWVRNYISLFFLFYELCCFYLKVSVLNLPLLKVSVLERLKGIHFGRERKGFH